MDSLQSELPRKPPEGPTSGNRTHLQGKNYPVSLSPSIKQAHKSFLGFLQHIYFIFCSFYFIFLDGPLVKNPPVNSGDSGFIAGPGRPLESEVAIHCSILAWRILWTEEPSGLRSIMSQRAGNNLATEQQQRAD